MRGDTVAASGGPFTGCFYQGRRFIDHDETRRRQRGCYENEGAPFTKGRLLQALFPKTSRRRYKQAARRRRAPATRPR